VVLIDPRTGQPVKDPTGQPYAASPDGQKRLRDQINGLLQTPVRDMTSADLSALHEATTAQRLLFNGAPDDPGATVSLDKPGAAPVEEDPKNPPPLDIGGSGRTNEPLDPNWEDPPEGPDGPPPAVLPNPSPENDRKKHPKPSGTPSPVRRKKGPALILDLLKALGLDPDLYGRSEQDEQDRNGKDARR
jgi:hypothetical protein